MTMEIEPGRIKEALEWCDRLLGELVVTKYDFQRFIGKLSYASRCTFGARTFMSRLLDFMGTLEGRGATALPITAQADIRWFVAYLTHFNGVTLVRPQTASQVVCVDACLKRSGRRLVGSPVLWSGFVGLHCNAWAVHC